MGRQSQTSGWSIVIAALLLTIYGLATLLSLDRQLFYQQLVFSVVGVVLFMLFMRTDFSLYRYLDRYIYGFSIILLLLTFLGPEVRGATRWLEIAGMRVQPSELVKPFLILSWASFLQRYPIDKLRNFFLHLVLITVPFLLVFEQPDLGNAIVLFATWLAMVVMSGLPWLVVGVAGLIAALLAPLGYTFLEDYQKQRLMTFINPLHDPRGAGYNSIQSIIAVGSGQLFGRGFGRGTQTLLRFLPEYHTDFIFASFSEEFGLFGSVLLLATFFVLLWQIILHARRVATDTFAFAFMVGLCVMIATQMIVNVGMNVGLVPITGITLPFVSYGGSSLLSMWISIGMLFSRVKKEKDS